MLSLNPTSGKTPQYKTAKYNDNARLDIAYGLNGHTLMPELLP